MVDKKSIVVDNKLKTIGIYEVSCKLGHSVNATLKIDIIGLIMFHATTILAYKGKKKQ